MASRSEIRFRLLALGLAGLALACAEPTSPMAADESVALDVKPNGQFNEKFTFNPVTFPDGTVGLIYAGSKLTGGGSAFTNCQYFTEGSTTFLGGFGSGDFASPVADAILEFCLAHFADRA